MKIGDICKLNADLYSTKDNWQYIKYLETGAITNNVIEQLKTIYPNIEKLPSRAQRKVQREDIVYSMVRPNQRHYGIIKNDTRNLLVSTGFTVISVNRQMAVPYYVYLYLTQDKIIDQLQTIAEQSTSAYPSIKPSDIESIEVDFPPIERQKQVVAILSALDNKIEVNRAINKNLEATAQAIFKSWFVDFEPFGGVMPADWSLCSLDECSSLITRGITPKYDDSSIDFVINQKCIRSHSLDLKLSRRHNSKVPEDKNLHYGDILINSTGQGTLGRTAQVIFTPNNLTVDSHITIVRPKDKLLVEYLGCLITFKEDDFVAMEQGSTGQTELPRERVKSYSITLPSEEKLDAFQKITKPILKKMYMHQVESQRLTAIRDALLPKLMSGEIDVSQVKI